MNVPSSLIMIVVGVSLYSSCDHTATVQVKMRSDLRCLYLSLNELKKSNSDIWTQAGLGKKYESMFPECNDKSLKIYPARISIVGAEAAVVVEINSPAFFRNAFGRVGAVTKDGRMFIGTGEFRGEKSQWEELTQYEQSSQMP
jgi:hypothetical protein